MKLTGTLRRQFFGGEVWVLEADGGASWQLKGPVPRKLEGQRVTVSGRKAEAGFGFAMVGEVIEVDGVAKA